MEHQALEPNYLRFDPSSDEMVQLVNYAGYANTAVQTIS